MTPILIKKEFAQLVDRSERQITKWLNDGMPAKRSGTKGRPVEINVAAAIWWLVEHKGKRAEPISFETARLKRAQAERMERENAKEAKHLIPYEDVQLMLSELSVVEMSMLNSLASRLAAVKASGDAAAARKAIQDEVRAVRETASTELQRLATLWRPGGPKKAAAAKNARQVGGAKRQAPAGGR